MLSSLLITTWSLLASCFLFPFRAEEMKKDSFKSTGIWIIEKQSTLQVSGKSNVNEFSCRIPGYFETDTIFLTDVELSRSVRLHGCMEIDIFRFDCSNALITKDLRKTLKASEYPRLTIRFLTLNRMTSGKDRQYLKGWVEIELAGVKKTMQIAYEYERQSSEVSVLNGKKTFCFSDFNLVPPRKLAGIIQIRDEFVVNFSLKLNQI